MVTLTLVCGDYTLYSYKNVGNEFKYSDLFLTVMGSICAVLNGVGRIFWGFLYQKLRFRKTFAIIVLGEVNKSK
jgi:hypothetical protein